MTLPLKTLKQIPTSRVIASSTAASYWYRQRTQISDRARIHIGQVQLAKGKLAPPAANGSVNRSAMDLAHNNRSLA